MVSFSVILAVSELLLFSAGTVLFVALCHIMPEVLNANYSTFKNDCNLNEYKIQNDVDFECPVLERESRS